MGKSELSRRVAGELQRRGLAVRQPSRALAHGIGPLARAARKSALVAREVALHPLACCRAARALASSGQPSAACLAGLVFNWLLVSALARGARHRRGLHLLDEGLAQGAWSVGLEGRLEPALGLLHRLPARLRPDLLVVVRATRETVTERLQSRTEHDSRLDSRLDTDPALLARGETLTDRIQRALESNVESPGARGTLLVSNERPGDLDACTARLAAVLEVAARDAGLVVAHPAATTSVSAGT